MTLQTSTLRPGLLVSLKTSVTGNVAYRKRDIELDHYTGDGRRRALWETERVIDDPVEHEEATKVRSKCRTLIQAVCSISTFGLLCPEPMERELARVIEEAQELAASFNRRAKLTRVQVYIMAGRIAPDDVEAVRAINSEVRDLLDAMEQGLRRLDVQAVRDAANKARNIGQMLSPEAAARIQSAIDVARTAARKIVKAGEEGAAEIDKAAIRAVRQSRTAFLDLDEAAEMAAPAAAGRAIDLVPSASPAMASPMAAAPQLDL